MAQYGLGGFLYELTVEDGEAQFHFFDPQDAKNTADVSVSARDFPENANDATSREVAELAFSHCAKLLNDKRDERIRVQAANDLSRKHNEEARVREEAADFNNNSVNLQDLPNAGEQPARSESKKDKKDKEDE